jgi:hypothetical protein
MSPRLIANAARARLASATAFDSVRSCVDKSDANSAIVGEWT